jgi:hypothetical protein
MTTTQQGVRTIPLYHQNLVHHHDGSSCGSSHRSVAAQGIAFQDLLEGTYYAAASLFTKPKVEHPASVTFNFGPDFKFPSPEVPDFPAAKPFSELPSPIWPAIEVQGAHSVKVAALDTEDSEPQVKGDDGKEGKLADEA